jgi:hypothetical protein
MNKHIPIFGHQFLLDKNNTWESLCTHQIKRLIFLSVWIKTKMIIIFTLDDSEI